ncbi:MAG: CBS domain-containing protein [Spirochaetota bacterium]
MDKASTKNALLARQIMSHNVLTFVPNVDLATAKELIEKHEIRHVPIVDTESTLIGIASETDILKGILRQEKQGKQLVLADCMSRKVLTAKPEAWIQDIARVMVQDRVGCMPVMNDDGKLLGIVTRSDILRTLIFQNHLDMFA